MSPRPEPELWRPACGAQADEQGVSFRVWAPHCRRLALRLLSGSGRDVPMEGPADGFFSTRVEALRPGARYQYVLPSGVARPDPASRWQPDGVHGPSVVVDPGCFRWHDRIWSGLGTTDCIIYEAHVGAFTPEGTFDGVAAKLAYLRRLGVTVVELMPVAQFPGTRNWGYDGVGLYAVQDSYGGPEGLKRLVDACHRQGLAVCLDVVYNHLGPEGNYLAEFGPYFTDRYRTPWGQAVNFDGPQSDPVRRFFIDNALFWVAEYHVDALRLDAVHGIFDFSARHILEELRQCVKRQAARLGRQVLVIAESDLNDPRLVRPTGRGGYGLDAQWSDDFHHALRVTLTGERAGYYRDFAGLADLRRAVITPFVYDGRFSAYRSRRHGASARGLPPDRFVVCMENHDQVGNRERGDRLSASLTVEAEKAGAALLLLSPYVPLLFMGQEYRELAPFRYFIDHSDPALAAAVREGRQREFAAFGWAEPPDAQDPRTFQDSKLDWSLPLRPAHAAMLRLYRDLVALRRAAAVCGRPVCVAGDAAAGWLSVRYRKTAMGPLALVVCFSLQPRRLRLPWAARARLALDTQAERYGGPGGSAPEGGRLDFAGPGAKVLCSRARTPA